MGTRLNIHEFAKLYSDSYSWLYEQDSTGEYTQEFAWTFTELMHKNKSFKRFVQDFVRYRGDFITSDREAAAFVLTMERMREGVSSLDASAACNGSAEACQGWKHRGGITAG